jgi:hypothetical protein
MEWRQNMKKIGFLVVAVALSLSLTALAAEKTTNSQTPSQAPPAGAKAKGKMAAAPSPRVLSAQIAQLKQEQQAAVGELDEVKKLAAEEKATKTVAALDKLIARRNQEFQKKIEPLEQMLKKIEAAQKPGADLPKDTKTAPKKSGS